MSRLNPRPRTPEEVRQRCFAIWGEECLICGSYAKGLIHVAHIAPWDYVIGNPDYKMDLGRYEAYSNEFHRINNVVPLCEPHHAAYDDFKTLSKEDIVGAMKRLLAVPAIGNAVIRELEKLLEGKRRRVRLDHGRSVLGPVKLPGGDAEVQAMCRWLKFAWNAGAFEERNRVVVIGRVQLDLSTGRPTRRGGEIPTDRWWSLRYVARSAA
ncbi:HNH endonuclease signature motif containing protein [Glycomyces sp. NPDC047010]|uniref:HNH endonuclease signature motif containing protein n=1 Tax=Glycomyces sp. NPDC047010 TaxID=3155023 RepID=UPI0033DC193F